MVSNNAMVGLVVMALVAMIVPSVNAAKCPSQVDATTVKRQFRCIRGTNGNSIQATYSGKTEWETQDGILCLIQRMTGAYFQIQRTDSGRWVRHDKSKNGGNLTLAVENLNKVVKGSWVLHSTDKGILHSTDCSDDLDTLAKLLAVGLSQAPTATKFPSQAPATPSPSKAPTKDGGLICPKDGARQISFEISRRLFACNQAYQGAVKSITYPASSDVKTRENLVLCAINRRLEDKENFDMEVKRKDPGHWVRYHRNQSKLHITGAVKVLNEMFPGAKWELHQEDSSLITSQTCGADLTKLLRWLATKPVTMAPTFTRFPTAAPMSPTAAPTWPGLECPMPGPSIYDKAEALDLFTCTDDRYGSIRAKTTNLTLTQNLRYAQDDFLCTINRRFPAFDVEIRRDVAIPYVRFHHQHNNSHIYKMIETLNEIVDADDSSSFVYHYKDRSLLTSRRCSKDLEKWADFMSKPNATLSPTKASVSPTVYPTFAPSPAPTNLPTAAPSPSPTVPPTPSPSMSPTSAPTRSPSAPPTSSPSQSPTTASPTAQPSLSPTTSAPSIAATTTAKSNTDASAALNANDATTSIIIAVVVVFVIIILVAVVAMLVVKVRRKKQADAETHTHSKAFDNPLYADDVGNGSTSANNDLYDSPTYDEGATPGYMDVAPGFASDASDEEDV